MSDGSKKKVLSNSVWMIIQHVYSMLTSLTVVALIARYLGPSDYGQINYCASVISIFSTLAGLGLDNLIVSEIIRNPEKEGNYLGSALVMRLITSFVSYPLFIVVIVLLHPEDKVLFAVAVLQGLGMIFQTYDVLVYWFRIKLKMKFVSIAMVCAITVTSIIRIVLLYLKVSVEWFALAISIQALVAAVIITLVFIRKTDVKLKFSVADAKTLLKISYNCIISSMSIIIYMQADKIILEKMTDSAHVGIYSAAVMLATCWQFVPMSLIDSARPVVLEKRKLSGKEYLERFTLVMAGANLISIIFAFLMSVLGWVFIHFIYGSEYMDAVIPLIILSWASLFAMTGYVRSIWITGESFYRYDKIFTVTAAFLDIALDILFIWKFGIIGAALATFITYIYEVLIVPLFFKDTRIFTKLYFQSFKLIPRFSKEIIREIFRKFG